MGCGGSKSPAEFTQQLWNCINKKINQYGCDVEVRQCIQGGANIGEQLNGRFMVDVVLETLKRNQQANRSSEADICSRVIAILTDTASNLLAENVAKGNLRNVEFYSNLRGDVCQSSSSRPLGLLGLALEGGEAKLELVKFLVNASKQNQQLIVDACVKHKPSTPLHKLTSDAETQHFLLQQLNAALLSLPSTVPSGQGSEGAQAESLAQQAQLMFQGGASLSSVDSNGNSVLSLAVAADHFALVKQLLALGADVQHKNAQGKTPLDIAESQSHRNAKIIALLKNQVFNSSLQRVIAQKGASLSKEEVEALLTQGAEIQCRNLKNETPLHLMVKHGASAELLEYVLVHAHGDVEALDDKKQRPIELCVLSDAGLEMLQVFLEHSTPAQLKNNATGVNVLAFAHSNERDGAAHLIQAHLNALLWRAVLPCTKNAKNGDKIQNQVSELIALGAQINSNVGDDDHLGWSPLHLVAHQGEVKLLNHLKSFGANLEARSEDQSTPLMFAAESGLLANVQWLRELGVNVNALNSSSRNAGHFATLGGHLNVLRYLALWGVNLEQADADNNTPSELAQQLDTSVSTNQQLIFFLAQCQYPSSIAEENIKLLDASLTLDVCVSASSIPVSPVSATGADDEDQLGEKSRGMIKGKPNDQLKNAAKKGDLSSAKEAVADGADIRHSFNGKSAYEICVLTAQEKRDQSHREKEWKDAEACRRHASNCDRVAAYLSEVATTKLREAIEHSHVQRVVAYHKVHADLDGLVTLAARVTDSVQIVDYLVNNSSSNFADLYRLSPSPYTIALQAKHAGVADYIRSRLSFELSAAVKSNSLSHVQECAKAGAVVDVVEQENMLVAFNHQNLDLIKYLYHAGARFPSQLNSVESIAQFQLSAPISFFVHYSFLNRSLRVAAAAGDFQAVKKLHQLGADINERNFVGATALSLSIQFGKFMRIVHYLTSRGSSLLHGQADVPTLMQLSKHNGSTSVPQYLATAINRAFMAAVQDGDLKMADALTQLGADINYVNESGGETCVHIAVAYQGVEVVKFVCERGAKLNVASNNGEYAVTQAASKGDYATVQWLTTFNPGTKTLVNGNNMSALDIAKRNRYNKMVQLLDPGNPDFPVADDEADAPVEPAYDDATLLRAAAYGQIDIINEFIAEKYASLARKTDICQQMIKSAQTKNQQQIVSLLTAHHKSLSSEVSSDQTADRLVSASAEHRRILQGFLTSISGLIAGGEVQLDPNDPASFQQLFSNMATQVESRQQVLKKSVDGEAIKSQAKKDADELDAKVAKLQSEMAKMAQSKELMAKRLAASEAALAGQKSALARQECYKEIQDAKDQLNTLQSSVALFTRAAEAAAQQKKVLQSIRQQTNLITFYSSVENTLQGLFLAAKSATSGLMSVEQTESGARASKVLSLAGSLVEMVPLIGATVSKVIVGSVSAIVNKMDKSRQQQEIANITTLGNVEELNRAASNCAGLLTLYYQAQLNSVDITKKTEGKANAANPCVILAEYVCLWIVKALKKGRLVSGLSLADQLWLSVVSKNPFEKKSVAQSLGMGKGAGSTKVLLVNGKKVPIKILIGYVALVTAQGDVYAPSVDPKVADVLIFSVVHISAFTTQTIVQQIITQRQLKVDENKQKWLANDSNADIKASVAAFQDASDSSSSSSALPAIGGAPFDSTRMSLQVHDELQQRGLIVSAEQLKEQVQQSHTELYTSLASEVEVIREDFQQKHQMYQNSIEVATETLTKETANLKNETKKLQLELQNAFKQALSEQQSIYNKKLADQESKSAALISSLEAQHQQQVASFTATVNSMVNDLKGVHREQLAAMARDTKTEVDTFFTQCRNELNASAAISVEAKQSNERIQANSEKTLAACEAASGQWKSDLSASQQKFAATLKQAEESYQQSLAKSLSETANTITAYKSTLADLKALLGASEASAKQAASASKDTSTACKQTLETTKAESKELIKQLQEAQAAAKRSADEAQAANKQAKKAADQAAEAVQQVARIEEKIQKKSG